MNQTVPMLEATKDAFARAGIEETPREILVGTGYWDKESIALDRPGDQDLFIAPFRKPRGCKRKDGS
ncbi:MAG: hypothetical protein ACYCTV_00450 [Leptospirales bacterium]